MAMRMTGMMSGMDTESIIQELVAVRQKKVDAKKKEQTKLDWKQEAWKELNTKLKRLQTKYIANMRFADAYSKKTTKVSNSNAVSIITGESAMNGVQTMTVEQLAKSGYLTGGKVAHKDGKEVTALTSLGDIAGFADAKGGTFTVKNGDKSVDITVTDQTTISDVLNQIKDAGINANFDAKQQRFYITSSKSGSENDFSITASDAKGAKALTLLGLQTNVDESKKADLGYDAASWKEYERYAKYATTAEGQAEMQSLIDQDIKARVDSYLGQYKAIQASIAELDKKYEPQTLGKPDAYKAELEAAQKEVERIAANEDHDAPGYAEKIQAAKEAVDKVNQKIADAEAKQDYEDKLADIEEYIKVEDDGTATAKSKLTDEITDRYQKKAAYSATVVNDKSLLTVSEGSNRIAGQDARITLNNAKYTNSNNTFEINGLTITALTTCAEEITVTTQQDTDGIYDMVKNFLKEYNEIVNEMDKLYNADRAKGYEPLTEDEKAAMSEKEVEKWEAKVKESLLRRDDNLSTVNSALQSIMASGFTVNGKTMYLHDFGIDTLGYFESADNEKHAYHIAGDPDDEYTSSSADKLKSMISNDPDTVISFFSQLGRGLYEKMADLSKSVDGYRSFGSFYDDKKMKSDYDSYTTKIKEMETKLNEYEDKWYKKFSRMETALAKMQSNMSAVSSLLGG